MLKQFAISTNDPVNATSSDATTMEFRRKAWVPKVPVLTPTTVAELLDTSFRRKYLFARTEKSARANRQITFCKTMQSVVALWQYVQWLFEAHGWKVVGAALLFYLGRQRYREFAARRHHQRTLAAANDPARVAVLQRETARVRTKQQDLHTQTSKVKVEKAA
ncbi:hypothetical protein PI126_g5252 [Phytophthora idaei]|nr:hypothetical protein PI126_g5252 [Phytophthora idaei]